MKTLIGRPIIPTLPTHVFATYRCTACGWVYCTLRAMGGDLDVSQCASCRAMTGQLLRPAPLVPIQEATVEAAFDEEAAELEDVSILGSPRRFQS